MKGEGCDLAKYSPVASARIEGAKGRKLSRCLMRRLRISFISGRRGSATMLRLPRAPVGMIHHKRARLAQNLVPDDERRTDGEPAVSRCWLNVNLLEWRGLKNLPVGHAVERHAAGQAHRL